MNDSDYTRPLAHAGEQQFACILRYVSGESAGRIDMAARDITSLADYDQQDAVDSAYAIYEKFCRQASRSARRNCKPLPPDQPDDPVRHPAHYTHGPIEVWDAIAAWKLDFFSGNVVKYIARAPHKGNELQDLNKARAYLDKLIALREQRINKESRG